MHRCLIMSVNIIGYALVNFWSWFKPEKSCNTDRAVITPSPKKLNPTESNPVAQETCNVFIRLKSVFMHTQILKTDHILLQVLQMWIFDIIYLVRLNMKAVLNEIVPAFLHRHIEIHHQTLSISKGDVALPLRVLGCTDAFLFLFCKLMQFVPYIPNERCSHYSGAIWYPY